MSDLHLEFGQYVVPVMKGESDTVLILAGDIGVVSKAYTFGTFLDDVCSRFNEVIMIMGNHEYYGTSIIRGVDKMHDFFSADNFFILDDANHTVDGIKIFGGTMWTDMDKWNTLTMYYAAGQMNDFKMIRDGSFKDPYLKRFTPEAAVARFMRFKLMVFDENPDLVISHHAPTELSISEQFKGDKLNGAYFSNLWNDIADSDIKLWIHGHTHSNSDYDIEGTRVICNPRGYAPHDLNQEFDSTLVVEI